LSKEEVEKLLKTFNISLVQLPKIKITDPSLSESCDIGDVIKIERGNDKKSVYYRVVVV
jgi:DNA-directed RNA polymerase subunit H (RpoH/RPB5)